MTEPNDPINGGLFDPQIHAKGGISPERISEINNGLTKREYFAAMAISSGKSAKESVSLADELIKLLNNG